MPPSKQWPTPACTWCGAPVALQSKNQKDHFRRVGTAYCNRECSSAYRAKVSSATMAETNRKHASERMRKRNPMKRPEVRQRVSQTLRAIGHKPPVQGGNGRGLTVPQSLLLKALGDGWVAECAVKTKQPRVKGGYPPAYKVDIADPSRKIAVEVDGSSHNTVANRKKDAKKDGLLRSLGWTVIRVSNGDVLSDVSACASMIASTTSP